MPGEVLKELNTEIADLGGFTLPKVFAHLDEMVSIFEIGATRDGRKGWMDDMVRTLKLRSKLQRSAATGITRERVLVMLAEFFPPESHNREQLEEDLDYYRVKVIFGNMYIITYEIIKGSHENRLLTQWVFLDGASGEVNNPKRQGSGGGGGGGGNKSQKRKAAPQTSTAFVSAVQPKSQKQSKRQNKGLNC